MIYFIASSTSIKIGKAKNPNSRIKQLQTGNVDKLYLAYLEESDNDKVREKELHTLFQNSRIRKNGEWFFPSDKLVSYINERSIDKYIKVVDNRIYIFNKMKR